MTFKYSNVNEPSKDHVLAMDPASLRLSKTAMVPSYRAGSAEHVGNGRELTCGLPSPAPDPQRAPNNNRQQSPGSHDADKRDGGHVVLPPTPGAP